jgi:hypothetical protein
MLTVLTPSLDFILFPSLGLSITITEYAPWKQHRKKINRLLW